MAEENHAYEDMHKEAYKEQHNEQGAQGGTGTQDNGGGSRNRSEPTTSPSFTETDGTHTNDVANDLTLLDSTTQLEKERDNYREIAQRVQADFENFRKRVTRAESDARSRAEEQFMIKMLPTLDACDAALAHEGDNESVQQLVSTLTDAFMKLGLTRVGEPGDAFDPNVHEAVAHEDGDGEHRILEVFRAGYAWNGRVIRPAMVKVSGS